MYLTPGLVMHQKSNPPPSRPLFRVGMQSAKPFLQSLELGLPQPLTRTRVSPPPGSGGRGTHLLAREGVGESQFRRGDIHCGTLYMYVLCGLPRTLACMIYLIVFLPFYSILIMRSTSYLKISSLCCNNKIYLVPDGRRYGRGWAVRQVCWFWRRRCRSLPKSIIKHRGKTKKRSPKSITVYYAGTKKSLNRDYNNTEVNLEDWCQRVLESKKKRKRTLPKSIIKHREKQRRGCQRVL